MDRSDLKLPDDWARRTQESVRKNEAAFKAHNDRRLLVEPADQDEPFPLVCECGDADCWNAVWVTIVEAEAAHAAPERYVVLPRHVMPDYEAVVERHERYWIVEKHPGHAQPRQATT